MDWDLNCIQVHVGKKFLSDRTKNPFAKRNIIKCKSMYD